MRLFGLEITKAVARPVIARPGGFRGVVREAFTGAWQRNVELNPETLLVNPTLFRCVTLIAADIAKTRLHLSSVDEDGIWSEVENTSFSPVLRRPNQFQTRQQFIEMWLHSKLTHGNTYVFKRRDNRNVVIALHVLDPRRVTPLVTEAGDVYYDIRHDDLAGIDEHGLVVPASEVIHDRFNCLYHPLVGLSPITAAGLAAHSGLEIANASAKFFQNGARPGGILTAPGEISDETAAELKTYWEANFSGEKSGKIAVVGDGLKYEPLTTNAVDSQLIEQLKWNAATIASVFGVPQHLVGVGQAPTYNNIAALSQQYYSQCLQPYIEAVEQCLDEGLALPRPYHVEFELDDLIRLDEQSLVNTLKEAVGSGIIAPNEARRRLNLKPKTGGDSPYLQQQNYSLEALAERDSDKPFAQPAPAPVAPPAENDNGAELQAAKALATITKGLQDAV